MITHNRKTENLAYALIWIVAIAIYLLDIMRTRATVDAPLLSAGIISRICLTLAPFILLFLINNYILIPRLLLCNRLKMYLCSAGGVLLLLWVYQYINFIYHPFDSFPHPRPPEHRDFPRPLFPLPLVLDFTYGILVIGCNIAVALIFRRFDYRLENERLKKVDAENQLAYLKGQINPHFYMNMLNNIHGMIEIDTEKAQEMVIGMSQLMRYMLYDSGQTMAQLPDEIAFIENYLRLMRLRYPVDKVVITSIMPSSEAAAGLEVPPLLFLVFIENAFKHGISYRHKSYVSITLDISGNAIRFTCENSHFADSMPEKSKGAGIGLSNVKRRLALIYGEKASLNINDGNETYLVSLEIPQSRP